MSESIEPVRYEVGLDFRCSTTLQGHVRRLAARLGVKPSEWLRSAVSAALKADGIDPTEQQQYALVANGDLVLGPHGAITTLRPEPENRGEWLPIENRDSRPFDPALHYRCNPLPLRVDGDRVIREYPVIDKAEGV